VHHEDYTAGTCEIHTVLGLLCREKILFLERSRLVSPESANTGNYRAAATRCVPFLSDVRETNETRDLRYISKREPNLDLETTKRSMFALRGRRADHS